VLWSPGCCDLKTEKTLPSKALLEDLVSKSRLCVVRDELTRNFLHNCDLPEPVACPSINYIEPFPQHGDGILHVSNYTTVGEKAYLEMRSVAEAFAEKNSIFFRETNNRVERDSEKAMDHVLLHYQKSGLVLSSALHGCIIAVSMGLKVLAVSGDRKIEGFMSAVGLADWVLDCVETEKLMQRLSELSEQASSMGAIQEIQRKNRAVAQQIIELYGSLKNLTVKAFNKG
jgi:hypothetical protein